MTYLTDEDRAAIRYRPGRMAQIVQQVSQETGIRWTSIMSNKRTRHIAHARQLVMYVARREGFTLGEIGAFLGRDHTTIMHGVRSEEQRRAAQ